MGKILGVLVMRLILIIPFIAFAHCGFSQDTIPSTGMGSRNFDHLDTLVAGECNSSWGYITEISFEEGKVNEDLWLTGLISDLMNKKVGLRSVDSLLRKRGLKPYTAAYNMPGFTATQMVVNGNYIDFGIVSALEQSSQTLYVGAEVRSSYHLYCRNQPANYVEEVQIDINFFKNKIMGKIKCPYQVFNRLALGDAPAMRRKFYFSF